VNVSGSAGGAAPAGGAPAAAPAAASAIGGRGGRARWREARGRRRAGVWAGASLVALIHPLPAGPMRPLRAPATALRPLPVRGVADIPARYSVILLDQFGVLHDGVTPYPGAVAAVKELASSSSRRVFILSNSSRRADKVVPRLEAMGFDPSWFAGAVTSGEVAHACLAARPTAWWRGLGTRCVHVTWGARGAISLDGLGLTSVPADDADVDFVLAHGTQGIGMPDGSVQAMSLDELRAALGALATRSPPPFFLCANPDLVTVAGAGKPLAIMPGTLAAWYAEAAGEESVILLGKPGAGIYSAALAAAGDPSPSSVLAIGDSLEHDIAGAAGAGGVDALFVAGGIHKGDLGVGAPGEEASVDEGRLAALLAGRPASQTPAFVMPYLQA